MLPDRFAATFSSHCRKATAVPEIEVFKGFLDDCFLAKDGNEHHDAHQNEKSDHDPKHCLKGAALVGLLLLGQESGGGGGCCENKSKAQHKKGGLGEVEEHALDVADLGILQLKEEKEEEEKTRHVMGKEKEKYRNSTKPIVKQAKLAAYPQEC